MKSTIKDVKNVQIAYIGGGSRAWAHIWNGAYHTVE